MSNITIFDTTRDTAFLNGQNRDFSITQSLLQMKFATLVSNNSLREIDEVLGLVFIKLNETDMFVGDASCDAVRTLANSYYIMEANDVDKYGLRLFAQDDYNKTSPLTINDVLRNLNFNSIVPLNSLLDIFSGVFVLSVPSGYFTGTLATPNQPYARLVFDSSDGTALPNLTEKNIKWKVQTQRGSWMNNTPLVVGSATNEVRLPAAGVWLVGVNVEMSDRGDALYMLLRLILNGAEVGQIMRPQLYTKNDDYDGALAIGGTFMVNCLKAGHNMRVLVWGDFIGQTKNIAVVDSTLQATYRTWLSLYYLG